MKKVIGEERKEKPTSLSDKEKKSRREGEKKA